MGGGRVGSGATIGSGGAAPGGGGRIPTRSASQQASQDTSQGGAQRHDGAPARF